MSADTPATTKTGPASAERVGVLLVNLGTPDTADARGVRVYLREFLSDARVIEDHGIVWKIILNCIILAVRPRRKAQPHQLPTQAGQAGSKLRHVGAVQAVDAVGAQDAALPLHLWLLQSTSRVLRVRCTSYLHALMMSEMQS